MIPIARLLALSIALPTAAAQDPLWHGRYGVTFAHEGDLPVAHVEAVFEWAGGRGRAPEELEVQLKDDGFEGGYGAFLRDFEAFRPEGAPKPRGEHAARLLDAALARHAVPVLKDGTCAYRYTVELAHDPDKAIGPDETPHPFPGGAFWTGRALFAAPWPASYEVAFAAPKGERVACSYPPHPKDKGVYAVPEREELWDAFLAVGKHRHKQLKVGGSLVMLEVGDELADVFDAFEEAIEEFYGAAAELVGGPPPPRAVVLLSKTARPGERSSGAVIGRDVRVVVHTELSAENDREWRPLLCHELFHLYDGRLVRFEDRQMWFGEGWTEFFTRVLLRRTGRATPAQHLETIRAWVSSYLAAYKDDPRGLIAAGVKDNKNNTLIYDGGALAALCLDLQIRDASVNKRSVDDVFASLYEAAGSGARERVSLDDLQRLLKRAGGKACAGFLDRHVRGDEPLPLAECLALAGVRVEEETIQLAHYERILGDLLQTPRLHQHGPSRHPHREHERPGAESPAICWWSWRALR